MFAFDFCSRFLNNVFVMSFDALPLLRWLGRPESRIDKATLGQLIILMELAGAASVAAAGRRNAPSDASTAVNYRQKLSRLEQALGLGRLTYRDGSVTRPTQVGRRVAQEAELFLHELRSIAVNSPAPTWLVGSGESWLHSIIVPAVVSLASNSNGSRWEVRNLRARDTIEQLRAGKLHFGFLRTDDAKGVPGLELTGAPMLLPGYTILAREVDGAPADAAAFLKWLMRSRRPLVQQGTTWSPLSQMLDEQLKIGGELAKFQPRVLCETHVQAVSAVLYSTAWCIVPAMLAQNPGPRVRGIRIAPKTLRDEAGLYVYPRSLGRFAGAETARTKLRQELGRRLAALRS